MEFSFTIVDSKVEIVLLFNGIIFSSEKTRTPSKKNISYFEEWIDEVDAVIIPEATCSAMINKDWEHFFDLRDKTHVDPQMYDLVHPLHEDYEKTIESRRETENG